MEGWEIIQSCALTAGLFDKEHFIVAINNLTFDEFNRFCRTYLHLQHYHACTVGGWVTDWAVIAKRYPGMFWQLSPIDFDAPISFIRRK